MFFGVEQFEVEERRIQVYTFSNFCFLWMHLGCVNILFEIDKQSNDEFD